MKIVTAILALSLIILTIMGCGARYKVNVYEKPLAYDLVSEDVAELLDKLDPPLQDTYRAREVISYDTNSARFIDEEGHEHFVTGDIVEVIRIDQ